MQCMHVYGCVDSVLCKPSQLVIASPSTPPALSCVPVQVVGGVRLPVRGPGAGPGADAQVLPSLAQALLSKVPCFTDLYAEPSELGRGRVGDSWGSGMEERGGVEGGERAVPTNTKWEESGYSCVECDPPAVGRPVPNMQEDPWNQDW